jgi:UDP-3-O-[3-hydroxymyristoyl] glucosamine N-acyltransferase
VISLFRIAEIVSGVVEGDGGFEVKSIRSLEQAGKDSITFFSERKLKQQLQNSNAGAVLIRAEHSDLFPGNKIVVNDPNLAHALISRHFKKFPRSQQAGIDNTAIVADSVSTGDGVAVGPFSTIGEGVHLGTGVVIGNGVSIGDDVNIGENTIIEDRVVIAAGSTIGKRCCISPGAVIGASGFGYVPNEGRWEKVEQLGGVTIGDDVDIGASTTIDRGALEDTVIGNGVKLDNHIQIAHNVQVGDHTIMAAFVGISGSVVIGRRCKLGARVGIIGHLKITDDVSIQASSVISKNIDIPGEYSSIIVAQPARQWRKNSAIIRRLDKLVERVKTLEKNFLKT